MAIAALADTGPPTSGRAILVEGQDTPTRLFRARCAAWRDRPALRQKRKGIWHSMTWREYYANARAVGCGAA